MAHTITFPNNSSLIWGVDPAAAALTGTPVEGLPEGARAKVRLRLKSVGEVFVKVGNEFFRYRLEFNEHRTALKLGLLLGKNARQFPAPPGGSSRCAPSAQVA